MKLAGLPVDWLSVAKLKGDHRNNYIWQCQVTFKRQQQIQSPVDTQAEAIATSAVNTTTLFWGRWERHPSDQGDCLETVGTCGAAVVSSLFMATG